MKSGPVLVATLFALTSFPVLAQQPHAAPPDTAAPSATPQSTTDSQAANPAVTPQTPTLKLRLVHAELVSKLDSKTAKTGDNVVAETKDAVKTADGTEIPKGTKLVGRVIAVQPSAAGQNSQVALAFDRAELKDGQTLAIQSQIQSIDPPEGEAQANAPDSMNRNSIGGPAGAGIGSNGIPGSPGGAGSAPSYTPAPEPSPSASPSNTPPAGTVVGRNGKIDIRATSIPGILLANNQPGEQDPRMARASSILLGSRQDVKLDGGTRMVIGVAAEQGTSPAVSQ